MSRKTRFDNFGNVYHTYTYESDIPDCKNINKINKVPNGNTILQLVKNIEYGKAIIFQNIDHYNAEDYNKRLKNPSDDEKIYYYGKKDDGSKIFIVKNGSNCYDVHNGKIFSGSGCIIFKSDEQYYSIFIKKEKQLRIIEGSADRQDYDHYKNNLLNIGRAIVLRELYNKISVKPFLKDIHPLAQINLRSSQFGLKNIKHSNLISCCYFNLDLLPNLKEIELFKELLKKENKNPNDNYILKNIYAIKLDPNINLFIKKGITIEKLNEILINLKNKTYDINKLDKKSHQINFIDLLISYLSLEFIRSGNKNLDCMKIVNSNDTILNKKINNINILQIESFSSH